MFYIDLHRENVLKLYYRQPKDLEPCYLVVFFLMCFDRSNKHQKVMFYIGLHRKTCLVLLKTSRPGALVFGMYLKK